jgi:hypothetical protein
VWDLVGDTALYVTTPGPVQPMLRSVIDLYPLTQSITFNAVTRQAGTDPTTLAFKDTLSRVEPDLSR